MEFETLIYEADGPVAWVTLNRPHRHNSFDEVLVTELQGLWRRLRFDDSIRAIVLTGSGDAAFCTGIDRNWAVPQPSSPFMIDDPGMLLGPKTADLWKPVVAAVNGLACGGAFYLLGEVETIVAADHAMSGNYQRGSGWRWARRITVQPFLGLNNRNVRYVTVRVYRNQDDGEAHAMADLSAVITSAGSAFPTTQVFDLYLLAVENIPGWWVFMDSIRPFVESTITDLETRNPGQIGRAHV